MAVRASRLKSILTQIQQGLLKPEYSIVYEYCMRSYGVSASTARSYALRVLDKVEKEARKDG